MLILCLIHQVVGTLFTHHQKCVLVDTQAAGNNRKVTAFLGGIDLCDGRYDTPEHRILHDLDTVFKDDFHNPTYPVSIYNLVFKIDSYFLYLLLILVFYFLRLVPRLQDNLGTICTAG